MDPRPPLAAPSSYPSAGGEGAAAGLSGPGAPSGADASADPRTRRWWSAFGDPELEAVVDAALGANLQLRGAWARLRQADALAGGAAAGRWPQVGLSLGAERRRSPFGPLGLQEIDTFSVSVPASYELDVFGRIGAEGDAARLLHLATRDDLESVAMSVAAQVVETWLSLVLHAERARILRAQLELNGTFLELVELRFGQGLASALDVHQQRQQVLATRAQIALLGAGEQTLKNQLTVLLGGAQVAAHPGPDARLPELPPLGAVGVPGDLLEHRPDLRAVARRIEAADHQVGAAIASWLPSVRLSGALGTSAGDLADLFEDLVWNYGASLTQALFDGGARSAEVQRRKAVVEELFAAFGQAFLAAVAEVDTALTAEAHQRAQLVELEAQLAAAEDTLRVARARYSEGLIDFLPVLSALVATQQLELGLVAARRQTLSYRIQLLRALGGTWPVHLSPPPSG